MTAQPVDSATDIHLALLGCCASTEWADGVAGSWPYADLATLLLVGEQTWWALTPEDWREALAAHPRIGDRPPAGTQERREQATAEGADPGILDAIAEGNKTYEARFGMTYVVRASGRTAQEMLDLLEERLAGDDPDVELRTAAEQQWEITALRLTKLWSDRAGPPIWDSAS